MTTAFLLGRFGFGLPLVNESVWFHGSDPAAFNRTSALIALVRRSAAHHRILLTSADAGVCEWLARRFPNDAIAPAPRDDRFSAARFLRQMNPSALLLVDSDRGVGRSVSEGLAALGVPVVPVAVEADDADASRRAFEALAPVLPRPATRSPYDRAWWQKGRLARASRTSPGRAVADLLGRRIASLDALNHRLGSPGTILCLGNGPSSEEPVLRSVRYDALFRANWRWKSRGLLDRPDLVVVGSFETTLQVSGCVFLFRDVESERAVLLRNLKRPWRRPIEYFTLERVPNVLISLDIPARPTSGALMILLAAALQPRELVIGGMDLFSHPGGRYPGESLAENDYAQPHDRNVEVMLIREILRRYAGTVRILSPALAEAIG